MTEYIYTKIDREQSDDYDKFIGIYRYRKEDYEKLDIHNREI